MIYAFPFAPDAAVGLTFSPAHPARAETRACPNLTRPPPGDHSLPDPPTDCLAIVYPERAVSRSSSQTLGYCTLPNNRKPSSASRNIVRRFSTSGSLLFACSRS